MSCFDKDIKTLNQMECEAIEKALMLNDYSLDVTAKSLGIGRATLYRKVKQYNISMPPKEVK